MSKIYYNATVNEDGSLTFPSALSRGIGLEPGDEILIGCPANTPECEASCDYSELFVGLCCDRPECEGYTTHGDELNIPARLLADADIAQGAEMAVIAGDKNLIIIADKEMQDDLQDLSEEIAEFLGELGIEVKPTKVIPLVPDF